MTNISNKDIDVNLLENLGFRRITPLRLDWVDYKLNNIIISFEFLATHWNHKGKPIYKISEVLDLINDKDS